MPRCQYKNSQENISQLEPNNPTTASTEYSNIAEAQKRDHESVCTKMIKSLKEEINISLQEIQENIDKQYEEMIKTLNEIQEAQANSESKENCLRPEDVTVVNEEIQIQGILGLKDLGNSNRNSRDKLSTEYR